MFCLNTDFFVVFSYSETKRKVYYYLQTAVSRFGFKSGICLLIAPVPVHCFSITFNNIQHDKIQNVRQNDQNYYNVRIFNLIILIRSLKPFGLS